jgi:DNA invertase Pin-like site-specific DNA recombinase
MSRGRNPIISDNVIKDMVKRGLTLNQMKTEAKCYNYSPFYNALKRNGLLKEKGRPKTIDNDKVIELHNKGYEPKEIAIELGCSVDPIYKKIREYKNGLIKRGLVKK